MSRYRSRHRSNEENEKVVRKPPRGKNFLSPSSSSAFLALADAPAVAQINAQARSGGVLLWVTDSTRSDHNERTEQPAPKTRCDRPRAACINQATRRMRSNCRNHPITWFQLANVWLTTLHQHLASFDPHRPVRKDGDGCADIQQVDQPVPRTARQPVGRAARILRTTLLLCNTEQIAIASPC